MRDLREFMSLCRETINQTKFTFPRIVNEPLLLNIASWLGVPTSSAWMFEEGRRDTTTFLKHYNEIGRSLSAHDWHLGKQ